MSESTLKVIIIPATSSMWGKLPLVKKYSLREEQKLTMADGEEYRVICWGLKSVMDSHYEKLLDTQVFTGQETYSGAGDLCSPDSGAHGSSLLTPLHSETPSCEQLDPEISRSEDEESDTGLADTFVSVLGKSDTDTGYRLDQCSPLAKVSDTGAFSSEARSSNTGILDSKKHESGRKLKLSRELAHQMPVMVSLCYFCGSLTRSQKSVLSFLFSIEFWCPVPRSVI